MPPRPAADEEASSVFFASCAGISSAIRPKIPAISATTGTDGPLQKERSALPVIIRIAGTSGLLGPIVSSGSCASANISGARRIFVIRGPKEGFFVVPMRLS